MMLVVGAWGLGRFRVGLTRALDGAGGLFEGASMMFE